MGVVLVRHKKQIGRPRSSKEGNGAILLPFYCFGVNEVRRLMCLKINDRWFGDNTCYIYVCLPAICISPRFAIIWLTHYYTDELMKFYLLKSNIMIFSIHNYSFRARLKQSFDGFWRLSGFRTRKKTVPSVKCSEQCQDQLKE